MKTPEPPASISSAIWDVALECAARREYKDCVNHFDSDACVNCKYWVRKYAPNAGTAIDLLMVRAEDEACGMKLQSKSGNILLWVILGIFLLFIGQCTITRMKTDKVSMFEKKEVICYIQQE